MHPHLAICQIFLHTLPFLPSADACHMHRDQVEPCYAEVSKHPLTVLELMKAPLPNTEEPKKKAQ